MRLCVLNSSYEGSDAPFAEYDPPATPAPYAPEHQWTQVALKKATVVPQLKALVSEGFDVFVNLCDGAWDEDRAGIEVVQTLERLGQAFTGAGSESYDPSREAMKRACYYAGVATPAWQLATSTQGIVKTAQTLKFPVIAKHPASYGSVGMGKDARCSTAEELLEVGGRTLAAYGAVLIEEFIEGREFTVLVAEPGPGDTEPRTWPAIEFRFPPGETFKHFDLKWVDWQGMSTHLVDEEELAGRIGAAAAAMFTALGCSGYGRCDLRMDPDGQLYMLEINPNCGIFYPPDSFGSADFALAASPGRHAGFLQHILNCALRRRRLALPKTAISFGAQRGYFMVAAHDVAQGEVLQAGEEKPHVLVSLARVQRDWSPQQQQWFAQYAWPLTDDLHVIWGERPEDWQPIEHSCDPSAWLHGLDLVARRPLAAGEPVTMDYATFCGPRMLPFACHCGAEHCRGVIRGSDHLLTELDVLYGDRLSDFVRRARAQEYHQDLPVAGPRRTDLRLTEGGDSEQSVVALRDFAEGDLLARWRPSRTLVAAGRHTLQVARDEHVRLDPPELTFINHSCAPNARFDLLTGELRAVGPVAKGQAVTVFYPATEWQLAESFACRCGSAQCLGVISGAHSLDPRLLARHQAAAHVLQLVRSQP